MGVQDWEIVLNQVHQVKPSLVHNKYHLHGGSVFVDWFIYKQKRKKKAMASRPCKNFYFLNT